MIISRKEYNYLSCKKKSENPINYTDGYNINTSPKIYRGIFQSEYYSFQDEWDRIIHFIKTKKKILGMGSHITAFTMTEALFLKSKYNFKESDYDFNDAFIINYNRVFIIDNLDCSYEIIHYKYERDNIGITTIFIGHDFFLTEDYADRNILLLMKELFELRIDSRLSFNFEKFNYNKKVMVVDTNNVNHDDAMFITEYVFAVIYTMINMINEDYINLLYRIFDYDNCAIAADTILTKIISLAKDASNPLLISIEDTDTIVDLYITVLKFLEKY